MYGKILSDDNMKVADGKHCVLEQLDMDTKTQILNAVEKDDVDIFEDLLYPVNFDGNKTDIVRMDVEFGEIPNDTLTNRFQPRRILSLAAVHSSHKILRCIIENDADVTAADWNGGNLVHCLVAFAFLHPKREDGLCETYRFLQTLVSSDVMETLLKHEDNENLRPLEFAAKLGTCALLRCIFDTDGVYVAKCERHGLYLRRLYDVTDYESFEPEVVSRSQTSPLMLLSYLDKTNLSDPNAVTLMKSLLITDWMQGKLNLNKSLLVLWFLYRVAFVGLFLSIVMTKPEDGRAENYANVTNSVTNASSESVRVQCDALVPVSLLTRRYLFSNEHSQADPGLRSGKAQI